MTKKVERFAFTLRDFRGKVKRCYNVVKTVPSAPKLTKKLTHHIYIVDESGSMYYAMRDLKVMIEKTMTVEEFKDSKMMVTLLGYSSKGDLAVYFSRVSIADVMAPGSAHVEAIRRLHARGMTCGSQAFEKALEFVTPGETTGISLHTDGYFNDRSASDEQREFDRLIEVCKKTHPNVFVNTVAHGSWADFKLLSKIANALSGKCVVAQDVKQVYKALHDTSALLAGQVEPAIDAELPDNADYQLFVSRAAGRVNGAAGDLVIQGIKPTDDRAIYHFKETVDEAVGLPLLDDVEPHVVAAFAQAQLAEGQLNTAKYALVTLRDPQLLGLHGRALTNKALSNMGSDLMAVVNGSLPLPTTRPASYGIESIKLSVLDLFDELEAQRNAFEVHMPSLWANYQRRGLKRLSGTWEEGKFVPAEYKQVPRKNGDYAQVRSFDIKRNAATINLLVSQPVRLVDLAGNEIDEVARVDLTDLRSYNNVTLVADGELNVTKLTVKFKKKHLFNTLSDLGVLTGVVRGDTFDPMRDYEIDFGGLPLIAFDQSFTNPSMAFRKVLFLKTIIGVVSACVRGSTESATYTSEQIVELKKFYMTPNLNFSPPSTVPYRDVKEAISTGLVDSYPRFAIEIGDTNILDAGKLHSANECLRRFFVSPTDAKAKIDFSMWADGANFARKELTSRTKITKVDEYMRPIFEELCGFSTGAIVAACEATGWKAGDDIHFAAAALVDTIGKRDKLSKETIAVVLDSIKRPCEIELERVYAEEITPLAFYIGATGLLPDSKDFEFVTMLTAEQLVEKYPNLNPDKDQREGLFFVVGDTVLSVAVTNELFSTPAGVEAAKQIQNEVSA
jgi:hypothetical protein